MRSVVLMLLCTFVIARAADAEDVTEKRQPNEPPKGFVAIFNGQDLTGWKGLVGDPRSRAKMAPEELATQQKLADEDMRVHWSVVDGVLLLDGKGKNICTIKNYRDFELFVDWKIEKAGDSGVFLRGSPQVQIWDNEIGSGSLHDNQKTENPSKPLVKADNPVGQWNTFHIKMVGERVTVRLNAKLVVDNTVMENYWERDKPIYPAGPIELQSHPSKLQYKNIFIREITPGKK